MRAQFAKTMHEIGKTDPSLFVLVGDIGAYGLREFSRDCPGRFVNVGIREQAMISIGSGLARTGFVPVMHTITPFLIERAFEQIKVDFSYHRLGGNLVSVGGGFDYSALGGTHHSYSDLALVKSLPETQIFIPGTAEEFDYFFKLHYKKPRINYFRLGAQSHSQKFEKERLDAGRCIKVQSGNDVTVLTTGGLLKNVLEASGSFQGSCELLYAPCIKPLDDRAIVQSAQKTKRIITVEDHNLFGGLADEARRALSNCGFSYRIETLGIHDQFLRDYGTFDHLSKLAGIDPKSILDAMRAIQYG